VRGELLPLPARASETVDPTDLPSATELLGLSAAEGRGRR
jgi:hypothetical protein